MKKLLVLAALFVIPINSFSQGREYLRNQIKTWEECKNVAMTLTGGDVALYGNNGWAANAAPISMTKKLGELNAAKQLIDDVVLTENGSWLILWGNNGLDWDNIPYSLEQKIREYNKDGEVITSITFNDAGDWIVITRNYISASTDKIYGFIKEGIDEFGKLWAAHLTDDGLALCYAGGYKFFGNVPHRLKSKLQETRMNVFRIKFLSDGAYFIADVDGNYAYYF